MYTAHDAKNERNNNDHELDERIERAVKEAKRFGHTSATIRVNIHDSFVHRVEQELEDRGFKIIEGGPIYFKGGIEFSWEESEEERE